jgi:hypothetical protein
MAVLQGQGRVLVVLVSFLCGAWVVAVPVACTLVLVANEGLLGIWLALVAGYATITGVAWIGVARSNWPAVAAAAVERSAHRNEALARLGIISISGSSAESESQLQQTADYNAAESPP